MGAANTISNEQVAKIAHDMSIPQLDFRDPILKLKIPDGPNQFIRDILRLHQQCRREMYDDDSKLTAGGIMSRYFELRTAATDLCTRRNNHVGALPGDLQLMILRNLTARRRVKEGTITCLLGAPYSDCGAPSLVNYDPPQLDWMHDPQTKHGRAPTLRALGIDRPGRIYTLQVYGTTCVIGYIAGNYVGAGYKCDRFGTTLQIEQLWRRAFAQ